MVPLVQSWSPFIIILSPEFQIWQPCRSSWRPYSSSWNRGAMMLGLQSLTRMMTLQWNLWQRLPTYAVLLMAFPHRACLLPRYALWHCISNTLQSCSVLSHGHCVFCMPDINCDSHAHGTRLLLCLCFVSLLSKSIVFSGSHALNLVVLASGSHIQLACILCHLQSIILSRSMLALCKHHFIHGFWHTCACSSTPYLIHAPVHLSKPCTYTLYPPAWAQSVGQFTSKNYHPIIPV